MTYRLSSQIRKPESPTLKTVATTNPSLKKKRIAVAIELNYALPWHLDCYQGVLNYAAQHDWSCVLDPYLMSIHSAGAAGYDGVIGRISDKAYQAIKDQPELPAVTLVYSEETAHLPSIIIETRASVRMAIAHLVACGYSRFGYVGTPGHLFSKTHIRVINDAVAEHGFAPPIITEACAEYDVELEQAIAQREQFVAWLTEINKPIGLLCESAITARVAAQLCIELGFSVPEDVGIVVLYGDELTCSSISPTLSCVTTNHLSQGYQAAALLNKLMDGRPAHPLHRKFEPDRIVARESTDVFLCDDPLVSEAMYYIAANVRKNLKVDDLADALHTSRRTLERRFEDVLGKKVYDEIRRLRVAYIQRLLVETDRSVQNIAHDCGFSASNNLSRYFKQETGHSPIAYRKAHHKSHE